MINLVTKSAIDARAKNSKRVTAQHLKGAVMADPQLDFLKDIVMNVPDVPEKKGKRSQSAEAHSDDEGAKKPKSKRGSRKKTDTDD